MVTNISSNLKSNSDNKAAYVMTFLTELNNDINNFDETYL